MSIVLDREGVGPLPLSFHRGPLSLNFGREGVCPLPFPFNFGPLSLNFGPLPSSLGPEILHLSREGVAVGCEVHQSCVEGGEGRGVFVSDEVDSRG